MLKFELKKIFKKRILLFFIFLSIILPIYKLSILKYGDMVIVDNEKFVNSIGQIFDRAEDKAISSDTLSDDEKKSFVSDLIDIKMDRSLNLDFDKLDKNSEDDSLEFRDVIFSYENKLLNLLEKYEIELSDEEKTAISWNRLEKELMIQNSTSLNNLSFGIDQIIQLGLLYLILIFSSAYFQLFFCYLFLSPTYQKKERMAVFYF